MSTQTAAVAPPTSGLSACFCVATPENDEQLRRARAWATAIVDNVGNPSLAQLRTVVSTRALMRQLHLLQKTVAANAPLAAPPAPLGGLREHTIVLMTRGLPAASGSVQGVLLTGTDGVAGSVKIDETSLGLLSRTKPLDPVFFPNPIVVTGQPGSPAAAAEAADTASLLNFLVRSVYRSLYLCTIGGGDQVDRLATRIHNLCGITVFFNKAPLVLDGKPSGALQSTPQVGPPGGKPVQGTVYYGTQTVPLVAADSRSFLPGSEGHVI